MKDPDIEFSKWKFERKQGSFRFAVRTSLPAILGVMVGSSIEPIFISKIAWSWAQTTNILATGFWASVGAFPFSLVIWWWREKKYKRHIAKFEKHT
ncbi:MULTISPECIES: hypothetical protein [Photobacterium]|uniref:Uncharacterized protein n=1 Tax=Photobacterium angustum (strain S14 / CCUG 15956) TaxID=314292 RepID=Q1ZUZ3_PHOAS|nr:MULTISPECIES: hypothetical protein [Photobacterium]EAS66267.1 hypothetical protein VAS14_13159 [Photobacterium angustum S14]PSW49610.1 hypothetical protein C0W50_20860 [Photobacterium leiognathi subsp. mandapamensis]